LAGGHRPWVLQLALLAVLRETYAVVILRRKAERLQDERADDKQYRSKHQARVDASTMLESAIKPMQILAQSPILMLKPAALCSYLTGSTAIIERDCHGWDLSDRAHGKAQSGSTDISTANCTLVLQRVLGGNNSFFDSPYIRCGNLRMWPSTVTPTGMVQRHVVGRCSYDISRVNQP
jgi:hypothetical protein